MKKIIGLMCLLFILSGCSLVSVFDEQNIATILDSVLDETKSTKEARINNFLTYYEYYLPSSMAEEELDSDSVVLKYGNSRVIMNLNVSNIINSVYYQDKAFANEGFFIDEYKIYERSGEYSNKNTIKNYVYRLYKYDDIYVLHLETSDMNYYGQVTLSDIRDLTRQLMLMAKNTEVKSESIIKDFSSLDVIDYTKKQINLFDVALPSNGELSSLLVDGAKVGDGDISKDGQIDITNTNNGAPIE